QRGARLLRPLAKSIAAPAQSATPERRPNSAISAAIISWAGQPTQRIRMSQGRRTQACATASLRSGRRARPAGAARPPMGGRWQHLDVRALIACPQRTSCTGIGADHEKARPPTVRGILLRQQIHDEIAAACDRQLYAVEGGQAADDLAVAQR